MNCAVVDSGASLVSFKRMDGVQLASIEIAIHKARNAAKFRRETTNLRECHPAKQSKLRLDVGRCHRLPRWLPLIVGDKIVGAVGCSGGAGSQDGVTAKAGVAVLAK